MSDPASPDGSAKGAGPNQRVTPDEQPDFAAARPPDPAWNAPDPAWNPPDPAWNAPNTAWSPPAAGWEQPDPRYVGSYPLGAPDAGPYPPSLPTGSVPQGPYGRLPRPRRRFSRLAVAILLVAAAAFVGVAIDHGFWQTTASTASQTQPTGGSGSTGSGGAQFGTGNDGAPFATGGSGSGSSSSSSASGAPADVTSIASTVNPALVDINVTLGYQGGQAAATGIVLTSTGEVLTNNHVVNGATSISATDVGNGHTYSATVVGYDRSHDIAVIQLSGASGLRTAKLGDSSRAAVGAGVVAIGNAGGTGGTPSAAGGTVVALGQQIVASDSGDGTSEQLTGLIETNADIQPGDSGGPLVDTVGEVIGIDTAASGGYSFQSSATQGFAVPIDTALAIVSQIEGHHASATVHLGATAFLGVELQTTDGYGAGFGGGSSASGATLADVLPGSPAAKAGLTAGDVITSVNGQTVDSPTTLSSLLGTHRPDDHVSIGWTDQTGQRHSATVQLATGPAA
jgi:S1-C subfamily serine protease